MYGTYTPEYLISSSIVFNRQPDTLIKYGVHNTLLRDLSSACPINVCWVYTIGSCSVALHVVCSPSGITTPPPVGTFTTAGTDVLDMPVDPNEPTYCLCHQVCV